jgi:hypothetical protein
VQVRPPLPPQSFSLFIHRVRDASRTPHTAGGGDRDAPSWEPSMLISPSQSYFRFRWALLMISILTACIVRFSFLLFFPVILLFPSGFLVSFNWPYLVTPGFLIGLCQRRSR